MYQSFYTGALGAGTCMAKMSVISNNIANINNDGFKPKNVAFTDLLQFNLNDSETAVTELQSGNGVRLQRTYASYNTGAFTTTNNLLDYAILEDNQFFRVQDPATGDITYTRNGHFHRGELASGEGFYLLTDNGKLVLDQNGEPMRAEVPEFSDEEDEEDYEVEDEEEEEDEDAPRITLCTFTHPSRLLSVGDNEYVPPAGMEPILLRNAKMETGVLERSGTDLAKEMVHMIECQRAYSYALRMVTTSDEVESTINSLRG